jgi:hypothetical protein
MPRNWREHRLTELERKFAREATGLALTDHATPEQLKATVARLRQLLERFDHGELKSDDRALIRALILESM